jgi:hypothetical protein
MWYRRTSQLNIPPTGELEQQLIPITQNPTIPQPRTYQGALPPLHDNCHCYIETMLDGVTQIWQTTENACQQCQQAQLNYNNS